MSASTDPKYMVLMTEAQMRAGVTALYIAGPMMLDTHGAAEVLREKLDELARCRDQRARIDLADATLAYTKGLGGRVPTGVVIDEVWGDVGTSLEAQIAKHFSKEPGNG